MKLSKRLKIIVDLIDEFDFVADIGCDHAYLSIYLCESKKCQKIIATEVADGPYNIAKENIFKYNLTNKIKLYLTDGLQNIKENIDTIIIAGMGANTITKILNEYDSLNKIKKLVIQSNNNLDTVRFYLNQHNFYIENEYYVLENKKEYITILATQSEHKNTEKEILIGKYNKELKPYYYNQINKINEILKKINNKDNPNYIELMKKKNILKEYIN